MKKSRLLGVLGAFVLTFGVIGVASAETLKDAHVGITVGWDENGDPFAVDANDQEFEVNPEEANCDELELEAGDIVFHFVQSGTLTAAHGTDVADNNLDVYLTGADDQTGVDADTIQGNGGNVDWFVWVSSDGGDVTIDGAESDVAPLGAHDGEKELRISHICVGDEPGDEPTPTPTFDLETGGITECPCDTIPGANTSGPADGAWLLVVALGVLLASIVVLTPARAKAPRR